MLWRLRAPKTGDIGFVFNAFLKSFRDAPVNKGMTHTVYYREMHAVIERALLRPSIRIVIACDPSEEDMIYGFGIGEVIDSTLCLHYIYVKHSFRQFGIGRALEAVIVNVVDMPARGRRAVRRLVVHPMDGSSVNQHFVTTTIQQFLFAHFGHTPPNWVYPRRAPWLSVRTLGRERS